MNRERYIRELEPYVRDFEQEVRDFEQEVRECRGNFRAYIRRVFAEMGQRGERLTEDTRDEKNVVRGID